MSIITSRFGTTARRTFLDTLQATGNVSAAARAAGIDTSTAQRHRGADEVFAGEWDDALEDYYNDFEGAAAARAMFGVRKPRTLKDGTFVRWPDGHPQAGEIVYDVTFSDSLVPFIAKAHRPERHRDRSEARVSATVSRDPEDLEALAARVNRAIEDAALRAEGEQPDGVRAVAFREINPEDLL